MNRFEVRNSGGMLLGSVRVFEMSQLMGPTVRFVRALDSRYYGHGLREVPADAEDLSFQSVDMKVSEWMSRPSIGKEGGYYPGRVDFCLIWDGPLEALRDVAGFEFPPGSQDGQP